MVWNHHVSLLVAPGSAAGGNQSNVVWRVNPATDVGAEERRGLKSQCNSLAPIIVALTLGIPIAIFAEASLSFMGVGINPPMPSWGQMLGRDGIANINFFWHLALFPALMIAITMLGFTLMGDGLRDALDPHMLETK